MDWRHGYAWDIPMVDEFTKQTTVYKQTVFENFLEKLEDGINWILRNTINRIQNKRKRKIKIKLHEYDDWEAFHTLSLIILPLLKQIQEKKAGSPWVDDSDAPPEISSTAIPKKNDWDWDDNVHKRWEFVLGEMIWTFEQLVDEDGEMRFFSDDKPIDAEGLKKYNERKQNGLRLFGKYFQSLWT